MTLLDFAGFYDPVTRLKSMGFVGDLEYNVCALKDMVRTFEGLEIRPDKVNNDLKPYQYIFIPGGNGIMDLLKDNTFLGWIRDTTPDTVMTAVCGGSLVLGAAGFIRGKEATTHPTLMPYLNSFTDKVSQLRVVEDDNIITGGGVTSAIDLGLYVCEKIAGKEVREKIQKQMDYTAYLA